MKLWLKVSLIAIILVTLATSICSLVMLLRSGKSNLDLAIQNTLSDQKVRAASWQNAMDNEIDDEYSDTARRSLARYLIDKFTDENTILISDNDFIYNCTYVDPLEFLPLLNKNNPANQQQYIVAEIEGKSIMIAGSRIQVKETVYLLYVVEDISSVYSGIEDTAHRFALINLAVILLAGTVIIILVRLVMRPISTLKRNTGLIAQGVYDKRIDIKEQDEIGELAEDFNSMAAAVQAHVETLREEAQRRTMLMSALTHELKTPMTAISGNAQTLLRTKMDETEREDALIRIDNECNRIEKLSQKLMQLIVLREHDGLVMKEESVGRLLQIVQDACMQQILQRGLTLKIQNEMDTLMMDIALLSSLLLNLIDNAGKASKSGDTIELIAIDNTIAVTDYGKGIPQEELSKITQPFYMVDKSRAKKAGGIGLGLALAEEISNLHGAKLIFISEIGRGTTSKVVFNYEE